MNPQDLIRKKRDGARFSEGEIEAFIKGVSDGSWADYQITALVMAMFIHGLNQTEQNALVKSMLESGEVLDFSDVEAPKADKHSTGGVGDKTSLIIAPLAAACGVAVPMISGRGLGHTGGTLDKLESIAGYNVHLTTAQIRQILKKCGFALAGQTKKLVPADRKLYALREVDRYSENHASAVMDYWKTSSSMDAAGFPQDFQEAWRLHMQAWGNYAEYLKNKEESTTSYSCSVEKRLNAEINRTWEEVLRIGRSYGSRLR